MRIINWLLDVSWNVPDPDDYLQVKKVKTKAGEKTVVMFGSKDVEDKHADVLKIEAKTILKTDVWNRLLKSIRYTASEKMVNGSKTTDDMVFAKAMLYSVDVLEQKIRNIAEK